MKKIYFACICFFLINQVFATSEEKINKAVEVVQTLCLSGTEYGIDADLQGNISIKNFKPKGDGALTINVREAKGSTALQNHLRLIGDKDVRTCTQDHIGRIIDVIFNETPEFNISSDVHNFSISRAKYIGYYPDTLTVTALVNHQWRFYRFTVKESGNVEAVFNDITKRVEAHIITPDGSSMLSHDNLWPGRTIGPALYPQGDYYIKVRTRERDESSPFTVTFRMP